MYDDGKNKKFTDEPHLFLQIKILDVCVCVYSRRMVAHRTHTHRHTCVYFFSFIILYLSNLLFSSLFAFSFSVIRFHFDMTNIAVCTRPPILKKLPAAKFNEWMNKFNEEKKFIRVFESFYELIPNYITTCSPCKICRRLRSNDATAYFHILILNWIFLNFLFSFPFSFCNEFVVKFLWPHLVIIIIRLLVWRFKGQTMTFESFGIWFGFLFPFIFKNDIHDNFTINSMKIISQRTLCSKEVFSFFLFFISSS